MVIAKLTVTAIKPIARFVAKQISSLESRYGFVALGYPNQENFIYEYRHFFLQAVCIGLGGSFDVFSGTVKRAPRWMIKNKYKNGCTDLL
ncbi:WecB/TagA/CpsF family glycosyltransferase [Bacillus sp. SL00103]